MRGKLKCKQTADEMGSQGPDLVPGGEEHLPLSSPKIAFRQQQGPHLEAKFKGLHLWKLDRGPAHMYMRTCQPQLFVPL